MQKMQGFQEMQREQRGKQKDKQAIKLMITCKQCGKEFEIYKRIDRQFCSNRCRNTFHALKYYYNHRNDPNFKEKRKQIYYTWKSKNIERTRELALNSQKKRYKRLKKAKLCVRCGKQQTNNKVECLECARKYAKK